MEETLVEDLSFDPFSDQPTPPVQETVEETGLPESMLENLSDSELDE